mmetsp:Transcript_36634/g.91846  ORF Transcript_36634/g.91846 Transcript_36634/m.91846 type:complete len:353 (-) Transcript_36634:879-1937(-)
MMMRTTCHPRQASWNRAAVSSGAEGTPTRRAAKMRTRDLNASPFPVAPRNPPGAHPAPRLAAACSVQRAGTARMLSQKLLGADRGRRWIQRGGMAARAVSAGLDRAVSHWTPSGPASPPCSVLQHTSAGLHHIYLHGIHTAPSTGAMCGLKRIFELVSVYTCTFVQSVNFFRKERVMQFPRASSSCTQKRASACMQLCRREKAAGLPRGASRRRRQRRRCRPTSLPQPRGCGRRGSAMQPRRLPAPAPRWRAAAGSTEGGSCARHTWHVPPATPRLVSGTESTLHWQARRRCCRPRKTGVVLPPRVRCVPQGLLEKCSGAGHERHAPPSAPAGQSTDVPSHPGHPQSGGRPL